MCRKRHVARNVVPIITCSPWKPVATKNVDPQAESAIVNGVSKYSYACSAMSTANCTTRSHRLIQERSNSKDGACQIVPYGHMEDTRCHILLENKSVRIVLHLGQKPYGKSYM